MKAHTHRRNISSDYSLVQRPIKSPNLPSGGRDYLEISGKKKLACKQPWKGRDAHRTAHPSKDNWEQPRDRCANRTVLRFDTVPKAPASPECAPDQYRQMLFVFTHISFLLEYESWKILNWKIRGVPATPGKWLDLATPAHTPRSTINWRRGSPPLQGVRLPTWSPYSPESHSSSPALQTAPQDCPPSWPATLDFNNKVPL